MLASRVMQWRVQLLGALALASALAACDPRAFDALQEEEPRREPDGGSIDSDSDCEDLPPSGTACTADGKGIATCAAGRASVIVTACPERELCVPESVQCACAAGLVRDANGVCLENQCGEGHVGGDAQSCAPALTSLTLSAGALSPALALAVTDYRADVSLATQSITLIATVPQGATLTIGEQAVVSGEPWQSPPLQLGSTTFTLVVSETGHPSRSYSVVVVRGKQETYAKSGTTAAADGFGFAVAVSGDTLVVGAPGHTEFAGEVYVFVREGNAWREQATLRASNSAPGDGFGWSVAIAGEILVVGAHFEDSSALGNGGDNSAVDSGAAYVFKRSGGAWNQQAYLKASNAEPSDNFGTSVAMSGETIVVGAPGEDGMFVAQGTDSGAAYVFVPSGDAWSEQAYLKADLAGYYAAFGSSVAIDGDTLVIGAEKDYSNATGVDGVANNTDAPASGSAYVFTRSGSSWNQQAYLKASNTAEQDRFGYCVAVSGNTVVVGAPYEDGVTTGVGGDQTSNGAEDSGAGYVFTRIGETWSQQAYLKASNTGAGDHFGISCAIFGDLLAIGADVEDSNAVGINGDWLNNDSIDSGAVYMFGRKDGAWSGLGYLKASNTGAEDYFGRRVVLSGDALWVGAWGEDSSATGVNGDQGSDGAKDSGAVYEFR